MAHDDPALAPVSKLDAETLVAAVNHHAGVKLTLLGSAPGGQVGAAYVRWEDGHDGVLTRGPNPSEQSLRHLQLTAEVLQLARAKGIPVPAYDLIARLPDALAIVQERLAGSIPRHVDRNLLEAMVAFNERFASLLTDRPDVPSPDMYLRRSGPGFCVHESLVRYDARTRRLLGWVRDVGHNTSRTMAGDDLVHLDFHPGNVLVDDAGEITGVIDWDGIGRGDRGFALVTLRFDLASRAGDPATAGWLDDILDDLLDPDILRTYWAHMSLRMVDWSIRHYGPADVTHWLDFAATRIR
ncbi:aminoglycoside phosphotransferase family protein [Actinopolymorpha alba]|uniref:aminoglycoside phosphotransferase family protein n=1 Tax=Actinopolymorpha alba TaxID=533267 RepID=UPI0003781FAB|nr:aminoglycoside phosphotransferase family protein [Actinopolymorpha alba]